MFKFKLNYFLLTLILFVTECLIGAFAHDAIIRPFGGDLLIGIFIYCFLKTFINTPVFPTAIFVLLGCYTAEIGQYFHFLNQIGWQNSHLARMIFGTSFSWVDMLCYTIGMFIVYIVERILNSTKHF